MEKVFLRTTIIQLFLLLFLICNPSKGQVNAIQAQCVPDDETGYSLWLRYVKVSDNQKLQEYRSALRQIVVPKSTETFSVLRDELKIALQGLLDTNIVFSDAIGAGAIVAGTPNSSQAIASLGLELPDNEEGFVIKTALINDRKVTVIASKSEIGALYGTYYFLRILQTEQPVNNLDIKNSPKIQLRVLNHWDNLNGSVTRGYAGKSIWNWDELPGEVDPRYIDYARANASVGINGVVLNNVNGQGNTPILTSQYLNKVKALADIFRPYGIRVYLSAYFASPMLLGGLSTADPLNDSVINWWNKKVDEIYGFIPDFGGFLVKANSEGEPGPQDYGRNHIDGSNMLGNALGSRGVVFWRAFIYNPEVDTDRAKRPYKEFIDFDGDFRSNVFIQPKNGTLDFQPREPFSPLFGKMPKTNLAMELQITQEYMGWSTHQVYLGTYFKEILDSDTYAMGPGSTVGKVLDGSVHHYDITAIAGVANIGSDSNWCGHDFAQANWYAYGRLAWDHRLSAEGIAEEWVRMTWGNHSTVVSTITAMMNGSHAACVNYMTPLGLNFLCDGKHYYPNPAGRTYYHQAGSSGIGYNRSTSGSGYVRQYYEPAMNIFNSIDTCPEKYLLWFHSVSWEHKMKSGRTLWNELAFKYHSGADYVSHMKSQWLSLNGMIDNYRFKVVRNKFEKQESDALIWRDTCIEYFESIKNEEK
jgi:alpha-glucuronidase